MTDHGTPRKSRSGKARSRAITSRANRDYLREALWHVYEGRCWYSKDALPGPAGGPEYEVDHIIPEALANDPARLQEVLRQFGLPPDFDLQSVQNRIPTTRQLNRAKGDRTDGMWADAIRGGLAQAEARAAQVIAVAAQLAARDVAERDAAAERSREILLPGIYDLLTGGAPWEARVRHGHRSVSVWEPDVYLTCHLPSADALTGSALLIVRTPGAAAYQTTFSHADVLRWLVPGRGGGVDLERRPFLRFGYPDGTIGAMFPNGVLHLTRTHAEQLCRAVDVVAEQYVLAMRHLELTVLESAGAALGPTGLCRLVSIRQSTWRALRAFADHMKPPDDTRSESWWLSGSGTPFVIFTQSPATGRRVRALLVGEPGATILDAIDDPEVYLCWQPPPRVGGMLEETLADGTAWTVAATTRWLHETLAPTLSRWVDAMNVGEDHLIAFPPRWPWRRTNIRAVRVRPSLGFSTPPGALPAPWERACADLNILARHAADVCVFAQRTPYLPPDAVPQARELLATWVERDAIPRQSHAFLRREFHVQDLLGVGHALRAPSDTAQCPLAIFRALEVVLRDRAHHGNALSDCAPEQMLDFANAIRPVYEMWWERQLCARQWRPR